MQSEKKPDGSFLENNCQYLNSAASDACVSKEFCPQLAAGQRLTFRLRANPTVRRNGKRFGLSKEDEQIRWLERKAGEGGFRILACRITPKSNREEARTHGEGGLQVLTLLAVIYEGVLEHC